MTLCVPSPVAEIPQKKRELSYYLLPYGLKSNGFLILNCRCLITIDLNRVVL